MSGATLVPDAVPDLRRGTVLGMVLSTLILVSGFAASAQAQRPEGFRDRADAPPRFERVMSLDEAVSKAQNRFKATAVKTETVTDGGQLVYRIRLLSADRSRVWTVSVDARSGQIN